ncbi:MAG TPA: hypothetical protein RMH99_25210 [Sandaracinaceae bacterium LLY-WYZ-13_1]|nr:hypothetical protein [Sandaracinaceae bacterium LLY-WYZ-13_1]
MPRLRRLLPAALLIALAAWPLGRSQPVLAQDASRYERFRERFDGTWVLATSERSAQRTVDRAIGRAVDAMNFFVRGVARPLLRDNTPVNTSIVLDFRGDDRIRVRFNTGWETTTRVGRTERAQTLDGDTMRVTQRLHDDGSLEQVFQADQGTRWNVSRIGDDGRMTVQSTVQGDMMPQPMRFSLPYRRQ